MKIYIATSWKNELFESMIKILEGMGHEVYNFKQPVEGVKGFDWEDLDPMWKKWDFKDYLKLIKRKGVLEARALDQDRIDNCDLMILLLPCGSDAHMRYGIASGQGKHTIIYQEPDMMQSLVNMMWMETDFLVTNIDDLIEIMIALVEEGEQEDEFMDELNDEQIEDMIEHMNVEKCNAITLEGELEINGEFDEPEYSECPNEDINKKKTSEDAPVNYGFLDFHVQQMVQKDVFKNGFEETDLEILEDIKHFFDFIEAVEKEAVNVNPDLP